MPTPAPSPAQHGRYGWSALPDRPVYDWPDGKRLAAYLGVNLEVFDFGRGRGAQLAPGGGDPDVLNFSWRDWGNRVGAWRLMETFDALCLTASVNSRVLAECPGLVEAFLARGDELVGHGRTSAERQADLTEDDERTLIAEATQVLTAASGTAPTGWLGPWISQSHHTPDLLAEAGYTYLIDWAHDDQPTWFATRGAAGSCRCPTRRSSTTSRPSSPARGRARSSPTWWSRPSRRCSSSPAPRRWSWASHCTPPGRPAAPAAPAAGRAQHVASRRDEVWLTTAGAIAGHVIRLEQRPETIGP